MNNIAIIKQGTGRYLFSLPNDVTLKEGDRVKCDTRRGITDGIAFADSAWVDENVSQLIGKLMGAKFPLKPVVGRLEYLPFEKLQDKPANKYDGMSNLQLKTEMCTRGSCFADNGTGRKHDCLFAGSACGNVADANRAEVIRYLLTEDAEADPKPQDKPAANPANKYEGMSNTQLAREMCSRGQSCHALNDGRRKHDCLFADDFGSCDVNDANRAEVIRYLLTEDAEADPKPEDNPSEDKPEPIKLYCVEDCEPGKWYTKGKVYEMVPNKNGNYSLTVDQGWTDTTFSPEKTTLHGHVIVGYYLVPLVKRPAKVGEWVYITKSHEKRAVNGEIYEVAPYKVNDDLFINHPDGTRSTDGAANIRDSEYLVLDGYHPEPEKAPETEYFSGKVVCVSSGDEYFAVGKMYEFVNGEIKDDEGDERPVCADERFKSVEEWNNAYGMPIARFIEFKGEAK